MTTSGKETRDATIVGRQSLEQSDLRQHLERMEIKFNQIFDKLERRDATITSFQRSRIGGVLTQRTRQHIQMKVNPLSLVIFKMCKQRKKMKNNDAISFIPIVTSKTRYVV